MNIFKSSAESEAAARAAFLTASQLLILPVLILDVNVVPADGSRAAEPEMVPARNESFPFPCVTIKCPVRSYIFPLTTLRYSCRSGVYEEHRDAGIEFKFRAVTRALKNSIANGESRSPCATPVLERSPLAHGARVFV